MISSLRYHSTISVRVLRFGVSLYLTSSGLIHHGQHKGPFAVDINFSFLTTIKPELS